MIKFKILIVVLLSASINILVAQRIPSTGFYPNSYKSYGVDDWEKIKSKFDRALEYKKIDSILIDSQLNRDILYLLSRIPDISWTESQELEIINFLEDFIFEISKNILKNGQEIDPYINKNHPLSYPTKSLWTILKLDRIRGFDIIKNSAKNIPIYPLLELMYPYYKYEQVSSVLDKITINKQLTEKEIIKVNELKFRHLISQQKDQQKSWKTILGEYGIIEPFNLEVELSNWYSANLLMRDVYGVGNVNIDIILDFVKRSDSFGEEYSLLYSAGYFISGKIYRKEEINTKTIKKFQKLVERICINQNKVNISDIDKAGRVLRLYQKSKDYLENKDDPQQMVEESSSIDPIPTEEEQSINRPPDTPKQTRNIITKTITRPEERGEDFSKYTNEVLLEMFAKVDFKEEYKGANHENPVCIELRKAAQVLGDRYIEGEFNPSEQQWESIDKIVNRYLYFLDIPRTDDRGETTTQMIRLGHLALPSLINDLSKEEKSYAGGILMRMRDEKVIKSIIQRAKEIDNEKVKRRFIRLLSLMLVNTTCRVVLESRPCPSKEMIQNWHETLIVPFLEKEK